MDKYDVFVNHRGPDVKGGFVAHLHEALGSVGLKAFVDKRSLVQGQHAFDGIDEALENARVHVAVVSKGYSESKYCLRELVAMMGSGKPVIPVFYDVEPSELRRVENGLFASAFEKHKSREAAEQVEEWADALRRLADVSGFCFRLSDYNGDEAELKQRVVVAIRRLAPAHVALLPVERHLVGVEDQVWECLDILESRSGATRLLGLVGMGGIGKTCLAKVIFNHLVGEKNFQALSFVEGDYGPASRASEGSLGSFLTLQRQVLWDLLHVSDSRQHSYQHWFSKLSSGGPVLIVLDDFHHVKQFEDLIPDTSLLAAGSCIIVTSRDRHFLRLVGRGTNFCLHVVRGLGCSDSEELFNQHAFGDEEGLEKFRVLAQDVSRACGGVPLALKVVGRSLSDKLCDGDEALWGEAIDTLGNNPDVVKALRWSYNCFPKAEKVMFLDVACFLYGRKKQEALEVWKSCKKCSSCCGCGSAETSLRHLIDKCLVEVVRVHGEDTLGMHNLVQEMGKDIGCGDGSHLWEAKAEKAVLDKNQGTNEVRALNLARSRKRKFEAEDFARMTKLHYLVLDGCSVSGNFGSSLEELRWLQWREMPSTQPPPMLDLLNLTSLDFSRSTNLATLWTESSPALQACPNLQILNLRGCTSVMMLPDSLRHLSRLRGLDLGGCESLRELPSCIGQLTTLQDLSVIDCIMLRALPDTIIELRGLRELLYRGCSSMSNLPTGMSLLRGLKRVEMDGAAEWNAAALGQLNLCLDELCISDCTDESRATLDSLGVLRNLAQLTLLLIYDSETLTKAPDTIGVLTNLVYLEFEDCGELRELPNSIGQLKVLKFLYVIRCSNLETLPDSLGELRGLRVLNIVQCRSITKLPTSIGQLSGLEELELNGCSGLQSLPDSLSQLNALRYLTVMECGSLEGLGLLRVLRGLRIWGCTSITELPGSCLVVMVNDHPDWFHYLKEEGSVIRWEVREVARLETNDCGYIRHIDDARSGRMAVQRVHKWPCVDEWEGDEAYSEGDGGDGDCASELKEFGEGE